MNSQIAANALVSGCVFALVALGFGLIYNSTRVFHFAHAGVYTTSAYILYAASVFLKFPIALAIGLAIGGGVLLGIALERWIYWPLFQKRSSSGAILVSSLGAYIVLVNLLAAAFGNEGKILTPGAGNTYQLGAVILSQIQVCQILVSFLLCGLTIAFTRVSRVGSLLRALVDNPRLLNVIGIDPQMIRLMAFALGSLLASTGACLVAMDVGMDPYNGLNLLLVAIIAVIVGGMRFFEGAILGAFLVALMQHVAAYQISVRWEQPLTFALLISFLLVKPNGILGRAERPEES